MSGHSKNVPGSGPGSLFQEFWSNDLRTAGKPWWPGNQSDGVSTCWAWRESGPVLLSWFDLLCHKHCNLIYRLQAPTSAPTAPVWGSTLLLLSQPVKSAFKYGQQCHPCFCFHECLWDERFCVFPSLILHSCTFWQKKPHEMCPSRVFCPFQMEYVPFSETNDVCMRGGHG